MKGRGPFACTCILFCTLIACVNTSDSRSVVVNALSHAARSQPANLTTVAVDIDPQQGLVLSAFGVTGDGSNGPPGTIQPGVALWDARDDRDVDDGQINLPPYGNFTTATSGAGHDAPSLVRTAGGSILAVYGALSTYPPEHPPNTWRCAAAAFCEPFKLAGPHVAPRDVVAALAQSPERLLPTAGLSEVSSATVGDTTIIAGQEQVSSALGEGGMQGYVTLHDRANRITFDTSGGTGLESVTLPPNDGEYFDFEITAATPGLGTMSMWAAGVHCTIALPSPGDTRAFAQAARLEYARMCPAFHARFRLVRVAYDPLMRVPGGSSAGSMLGVAVRHADVTSLPGGASIGVACSGSLSCASAHGVNTVDDVRGSGLHRHFLWGGVVASGRWFYDLIDVEQATGTWYGPEHNSYALALACFRAAPPVQGRWTWTDCSGHHPFGVTAGMRPEARLRSGSPYLISRPVSGYGAGVIPYVEDFSASAQPPRRSQRGYPVISAESLTTLPNGNLLIVYGCQTRESETTVCYATYDTRNGRTLRAGIVDDPAGGGSLASVALARANGVVSLAILSGAGDRWSCGARGACLLIYDFGSGEHPWTLRSARPLGGDDSDGFAGVVEADGNHFLVTLHRIEPSGTQLLTFVADPR
jgi:hypothetical protein